MAELYDVFEPTCLAAGLEALPNLGHLIFGCDAWLSLGGTVSTKEDPITALYGKHREFWLSRATGHSSDYS